MKTKLQYSVPDGYFEDLNRRLSAIPGKEGRRSVISRLTPYLAMAACFFLSVIIGTAILKKTASPLKTETLTAAEMTADAEMEEDIIEYLIASDTPLAQIEDFMYNYQ